MVAGTPRVPITLISRQLAAAVIWVGNLSAAFSYDSLQLISAEIALSPGRVTHGATHGPSGALLVLVFTHTPAVGSAPRRPPRPVSTSVL